MFIPNRIYAQRNGYHIINLKCDGNQQRIIITLQTNFKQQYTATIFPEAVEQYEQIISFWDLYSILSNTPIHQIHSFLQITPQNMLSITIATIPNSTYKTMINLPLVPKVSKQSGNMQTMELEQRLAKVQQQNFDLKLKMQQVISRLQWQEQKVNSILSLVKLQMVKFEEDIKSKVQDFSITISKMSTYQSKIN